MVVLQHLGVAVASLVALFLAYLLGAGLLLWGSGGAKRPKDEGWVLFWQHASGVLFLPGMLGIAPLMLVLGEAKLLGGWDGSWWWLAVPLPAWTLWEAVTLAAYRFAWRRAGQTRGW